MHSRRTQHLLVRDAAARRWLRVLAHPVSVVALVTWIANDVLLKGTWPGIVTGKLGDVASLIVLVPLAAVIFSLVVPARWLATVPHLAVGAVAALYTALNLSPALAEVWSGALSGLVVSSQWWADPTDLIALPVMAIPLWLWRNAQAPRSAWLGELAQLTLLIVALSASLATSCSPDAFIAAVSSTGDDVWVVSATEWGIVDYAVSTDGGLSWESGDPPPAVKRDLKAAAKGVGVPSADTVDPVEVCSGSSCWRASNESRLDRSDDGGSTWGTVWEDAPDAQELEEEELSCRGVAPVGVSDVAVAEGGVVAAVGARGVLVGDGTTFNLEAVAPLDVYPATRSVASTLRGVNPLVGAGIFLAAVGLAVTGLVVALVFVRRLVVRRRRKPPA